MIMSLSRADQEFLELNDPEEDDNEHTTAPDENDGRTTIAADPTDIKSTVDSCIKALNKPHLDVFQRDGMIVTVKTSKRPPKYGLRKDDIERMRMVEAHPKFLQELATQEAHWLVPSYYKRKRQYYKPGACPEAIVLHMARRRSLPFPVLAGIVNVPTLRHDGSIIVKPGYDKETGLYYAPQHTYPHIPESPTIDDARISFDELADVFSDFPFASSCHRSAAIGGILTIIARHLVRCAPMHAVTSNTPGSGKGLALNVISIIATGNVPALADNADDDEMRKTLLAIALEGAPVTAFDNVKGAFGSPALDKALTAEMVSGRPMGKTEILELEMKTSFFCTGNNIRWAGDISRRIIPITLAPKEQNPDERVNFKHRDLLEWTNEHHPELLVHAVTILRAYILAGLPDQRLTPYGSFENWSNLVRSSLIWLGADDPCEGRKAIRADADDDVENLRFLLSAWHDCYPKGYEQKSTLKSIVDIVKSEYAKSQKSAPYDREWTALGEALAVFDAKSGGRINDIALIRLGRRLPVNNGASRVIDELRLCSERDEHTRINSWWVQKVKGSQA
jgi:putative DNA primase/helicase